MRDTSTHRPTLHGSLVGEPPLVIGTQSDPYNLRDLWKSPDILAGFGRRQLLGLLGKALARLAMVEGWTMRRTSTTRS